MHNKIPSDDQLRQRGISGPSMCSCCKAAYESSFHLFFECSFSMNIWRWIVTILNKAIQFSSLKDIWLICENNWSPQCKVAIQSVLVNIINIISYSRNQIRFHGNHIHWRTAINMVISNVALSANNSSKTACNLISEFSLLKALCMELHPPRAPKIIEVIWFPPL